MGSVCRRQRPRSSNGWWSKGKPSSTRSQRGPSSPAQGMSAWSHSVTSGEWSETDRRVFIWFSVTQQEVHICCLSPWWVFLTILPSSPSLFLPLSSSFPPLSFSLPPPSFFHSFLLPSPSSLPPSSPPFLLPLLRPTLRFLDYGEPTWKGQVMHVLEGLNTYVVMATIVCTCCTLL